MKNLSMKKKVWLAIFFIVIIVLIGAICMIVFLYNKLYIDKQIDALMRHGETLQSIYHAHESDEYFYEQLLLSERMSGAKVLYTNNPMELGSGVPFIPHSNEDLITFEERQQLLQGETVVMIRSHPHFEQQILGIAVPLFTQGELNAAILLSMPLSEIQEPFTNISSILIASLIVIVIIIIFIGNYIINDIVSPIEKMKRGAGVMASGDFSMRIDDVDRKDELGQLARSFNTLAISLEKVEENRREFLANVSHELRTPLSYMKGYVEAMDEGVIPYKKGMEIIEKEADRLERLVNDLLDLAQLEGESYPLKMEPIVFSQLIHDVIEQMKWTAEKKNLSIYTNVDEQIIIYGDSDRLEQVVRNLLDNAIKFTPPHKKITITLKEERKNVQLIVEDEGIGIPENEIEAVKERFYRIDKARTRKKGGSGLGLAIVNEIVKKHNGTFELISTVKKGTRATVTFGRENKKEK